MSSKRILFIEPFYGGSHKQLIDTISDTNISNIITLPAKKWHWKARCGALMIYNMIPPITSEEVIFCSATLNLAELLGIRPDLHHLKKIIYFHENQLIYPIRKIKERDIQFAYNQIISCFAADIIIFNSNFNKSSFFLNIHKVIRLLPNFKLEQDQVSILENKSKVLYFPISYPIVNNDSSKRGNNKLHILWPHRWEFDKCPEDFFKILFQLKDNNVDFSVSIIGESYSKNPEIFEIAKERLIKEIIHFGYIQDKNDYYELLKSAHVVVSTAEHEFFGVAMLEAVYCGCYPLAPNRLVYPEIYPSECLYADLDDLYDQLKFFCLHPASSTRKRCELNMDFNQFDSKILISQYQEILQN